jgi:hypothetical protein
MSDGPFRSELEVANGETLPLSVEQQAPSQAVGCMHLFVDHGLH